MSRIIEKSVCVRTQAAVRIGLGIWVVKVKTYRVGFVIVWKGAFPGQAMLSFIIPGEANARFFFVSEATVSCFECVFLAD